MGLEGMARMAGMVAGLTIVAKVFGFFRESSLAAVFGATKATDAYLMGQTIPVMFFTLVGATLGTSFIPVYARIRQERGLEDAHAMADSVITATGLITLAVTAFGELLAPGLTRLVAPGFGSEVYTLTVNLTRILFPMTAFQSLSGLLTGILQAEGNFAVPAMVGLLNNVVIIIAILTLGPRYGIKAVALATVVAAISQVLLQWPALVRHGYRWRPRLDLKEPGLRRIALLTAPVLLGVSVGQVNAIIDRMLASGLAEGSVAALNYANKLMLLVPSVLGAAIVTVMYPTLAKLSAAQEWDRYTASLAQAVTVTNYFMVPVTAGMIVLSGPLVQLAFGRGAFGSEAALATSFGLRYYALSVSVFTLRELLSRAFYALQDTLSPMITGAIGVGLNITLNLALIGPMKHGGLALATSIALFVSTVGLFCTLRRRLKVASSGLVSSIHERVIMSSLWRVALAAVVMAAVVWIVRRQLEILIPGLDHIAQATRLLGAVGIGATVYAGLTLAFKVPEAWLTFSVARAVVSKGLEALKTLLFR